MGQSTSQGGGKIPHSSTLFIKPSTHAQMKRMLGKAHHPYSMINQQGLTTNCVLHFLVKSRRTVSTSFQTFNITQRINKPIRSKIPFDIIGVAGGTLQKCINSMCIRAVDVDFVHHEETLVSVVARNALRHSKSFDLALRAQLLLSELVARERKDD